jgi:glycosyltransferase involved in cell wall biosynthesis
MLIEKQKLSLIICTRNRVDLLKNLLSSIVNSQSQPHEIVIVSSGKSIYELVNQYSSLLKIKHLHTKLIGQSNQKKLAFNLLNDDSNWVFFLDDDLELMPTTLTDAFLRIGQVQNENVSGIGTRLIDKSSNFQKLQKRQSNSTRQIGKIKPSGRASKYAFNSFTSTEWLNGASIWRKDSLDQYTLPILNSKYAAYEDVIFSSNVSKYSQLIYDPEIKVLEQLSHANIKLNLSQFKYISLWTGFLVCSRADTRIDSFKCLTIFRAFKFLLTGGFLQIVRTRKIIAFLKFSSQMISLPMNKSKSKEIIIGLLKIESSVS